MNLELYELLFNNKECRKVSEVIKCRLFFASFKKDISINSDNAVYFKVNTENSLNLAAISRFIKDVNFNLSAPELMSKAIVYWASGSEKKRRDAAVCVGVYAVIDLGMSVKEVTELLLGHSSILSSEHFLNSVLKADELGLIDFGTFNEDNFEELDKCKLNWIVPKKVLAFSGPLDIKNENYLAPKRYLQYFRQIGVKTFIRLNHLKFDANPFVNEGLSHYDMKLSDYTPSRSTLRTFLDICERSQGVIVIHCREMLGRSGCLLAAFLVKHCQFTAEQAFAWLKLCSPECVTEAQTKWLKAREKCLWNTSSNYSNTLIV